jgi:dihydrolipoamide dehydrogenase
VFPARKAHALGLHLTRDGYIRADACGRTANPHVYCIGDANGQEKTAYYGTWQAEQAAELILQKDTDTGESSQLFPDMGWKTHSEADISREWEGMCAPACLHIDPPAACVGMSIEEIRARGYIIRTGKAPVYASGAARIRQYTDGSVTVWRDTKTDLLLGACVIAPEAEEMIHLLQSYILYRIPCSQICRQVFAHPSLSELVRMAVEDACGGSPELPVKRRR